MAKHYLQVCLEQFPDVSKQRWERGRTFDLEAIEEKVKDLQTKEVSVSELHERFSDYLNNDKFWWFSQYWLFPSLEYLSQKDKEQTFRFPERPREIENKNEEKELIQNLLKAFRQIELVSIMLRFICPESFGILSPPVEHVLNLRRGTNAVATYRNYLKDIRKIRDSYALHTAAKTDMALWVLEHRCYGELNLKNGNIKEEFQKDEFMLQLRAKNLAEAFTDLTWAQLAIALYNVKNDLAAVVGSYALEKNVKEWAKASGVNDKVQQLWAKGGVGDKVSRLRTNKTVATNKQAQRPTLHHYFDALSQQELSHIKMYGLNKKDLVNTRNDILHADKIPDGKTLNKFIQTVLKIEQRVNELRQR